MTQKGPQRAKKGYQRGLGVQKESVKQRVFSRITMGEGAGRGLPKESASRPIGGPVIEIVMRPTVPLTAPGCKSLSRMQLIPKKQSQ
jgi:hypothetical protein